MESLVSKKKWLLIIWVVYIYIYIFFNFPNLQKLYLDFGDMALISLKVEMAKEFRELLGPYSRMGFFHLGPISFYMYAWLSTVVQRGFEFFSISMNSISAIYYFSQFWIHLFFLIFIYRLLPLDLYKKSIFIVFYLIFLENINIDFSLSLLFDIWGPAIIIIPFMLMIISVFHLYQQNKNRVSYVLLFISVGWIISNHLSGILYSGFFVFVILVFLYFQKKILIKSIEWVYLSIGILVLFIIMLPPLWEFFLHYPEDNISKIVQISLKESSWRKGKDVLLYFFRLWSLFITGKENVWVGIGFSFLIITGIIYLKNRIPEQKWNSYQFLFTVSNIQTLFVIFYIFKIPYDLMSYLSWFYFNIVYLYLIILFFLIIELLYNQYLEKIILLIGALLLVFQIYNKSKHFVQPFEKEYHIQKIIMQTGKFQKKQYYKLQWGFNDENHNHWVLASGLALQLYRQNIPFCVEENWLFMFGNQFRCKNSITSILYIKKNQQFFSKPEIKIKLHPVKTKWIYYYHYKIILKEINYNHSSS